MNIYNGNGEWIGRSISQASDPYAAPEENDTDINETIPDEEVCDD